MKCYNFSVVPPTIMRNEKKNMFFHSIWIRFLTTRCLYVKGIFVFHKLFTFFHYFKCHQDNCVFITTVHLNPSLIFECKARIRDF